MRGENRARTRSSNSKRRRWDRKRKDGTTSGRNFFLGTSKCVERPKGTALGDGTRASVWGKRKSGLSLGGLIIPSVVGEEVGVKK